MQVDGIGQFQPRIGQVVADVEPKALELFDQRPGDAGIAVPKYADVPGAVFVAEIGGETMNGKQCRWLAPPPQVRQGFVNSVVIGIEQHLDALFLGFLAEPHVAGDFGAGAGFGDRLRVTRRPVDVDHQPRIPGQHPRCVQLGRQQAGHAGGADVIGDMAFEVDVVETEPIQRRRNRPAGVVRHQDHRRAAVGVQGFENGRVARADQDGQPFPARTGKFVHRSTILQDGPLPTTCRCFPSITRALPAPGRLPFAKARRRFRPAKGRRPCGRRGVDG